MSTQSKFGYGFTFLGIALAYFIDKLFGPVWAFIIVAIVLIAGIVLLRSAQEEEEEGDGVAGSILGLRGEEAADTKSPRPCLDCKSYQFVTVVWDDTSHIVHEGWGRYSQKAFVFHVENHGGRAGGARARIVWTYGHGADGPSFLPAAWIDEELGIVDIESGCSKKLIIGIKSEAGGDPQGFYWNGYSNQRTKHGDSHQLDGQPLPYDGSVVVEILGPDSTQWGRWKWKWTEDLAHGAHPTVTPQ